MEDVSIHINLLSHLLVCLYLLVCKDGHHPLAADAELPGQPGDGPTAAKAQQQGQK
jgi:hypothetical protein